MHAMDMVEENDNVKTCGKIWTSQLLSPMGPETGFDVQARGHPRMALAQG
jgi:hypothetical protein